MSGYSRLLLLGASHHTAPLAVREKLAVSGDRLRTFHQGLHELPGMLESLVLSTCNRLEVYCVMEPGTTEEPVEQFICDFQQFPLADFHAHRQVIWNRAVIEHLIAVAAGVDSQMVGETEIFGQVKDAYASAADLKFQGPVLHRIFQKSFQAAKHIRSSGYIGYGQISLTSVAIELASKIFGSLETCRVLVIGTGEIADKAARAFSGRGARRLTVISRSLDRARALATDVGAKAGTFDTLNDALRTHDIVIGSTQTTEPVVTADQVREIARSRKLRPLFLIDVGVPRNFEAATGDLDSVFVYDLDDLVRIADDNLAARRAAVGRCREIAREKSAVIWERVEPRLAVSGPTRAARALATREQTT